MINEEMKNLLKKCLAITVEEGKQVRIESRLPGYTFSSYQDKIGTLQSVYWYMGEHCDGRHDYITMSIRNTDGSEGGFLSIKLDEISTLSITVHPKDKSAYTHIEINNSLKIYIK